MHLSRWSIPKTKYLCHDKYQHCSEPVQVAEHQIEQVSKFKYLGSMQTSDLSVKAEASNRLASAVNARLKLSKVHVWDDECISRSIKCTLYSGSENGTGLRDWGWDWKMYTRERCECSGPG